MAWRRIFVAEPPFIRVEPAIGSGYKMILVHNYVYWKYKKSTNNLFCLIIEQ